VPGDTYRNLLVRTQWNGEKVKSALLPVWIAAYRYRDKPFRFLVNGVTGKVAGKAPLSVFKVALAVLVALVILLILATLSR